MSEEVKKKRKHVVVEEVAEESPVEAKAEEVKVEEPIEAPVEPVPVSVETETPQPDQVVAPPTEYKEKRSFNVFFFFLILFFAFIITVLIGGIFVYVNGTKSNSTTTPVPSVTPNASSTPESTPAATVTASPTPAAANIKISILNGSGKSGEAGRAKALVEKAGFNVESTGNASAFNFTDTQVQVKSGVSAEIVTKIKESLSGTYSLLDGKALDTKSKFDVIITIGSKSAN